MSTVLGRVLAQAQQHPQAIALRRCDGTSAVTYGRLSAVVDRLAAELHKHGVARGGRVFVMSDNGPETYVAVLACAHLGAIAVLVDRGVPTATVARFGEIAGPSAVLLTPGADPTALPNALGAIPVIVVDVADGAERSDAAPGVAPAELGADDPLAMIFTSGTTGEPKAVLLANRTFFAVADILARENLTWISWVVGEATYSPLPASHIGGLWWILNCLMHGSECVTGGENPRRWRRFSPRTRSPRPVWCPRC